MSLLQSILMGIIQGATEFLPVSSSGHLALFKIIFNVNTETGLLFDTMLHLGTLVAVCIVYWKDVRNLIVAAFHCYLTLLPISRHGSATRRMESIPLIAV